MPSPMPNRVPDSITISYLPFLLEILSRKSCNFNREQRAALLKQWGMTQSRLTEILTQAGLVPSIEEFSRLFLAFEMDETIVKRKIFQSVFEKVQESVQFDSIINTLQESIVPSVIERGYPVQPDQDLSHVYDTNHHSNDLLRIGSVGIPCVIVRIVNKKSVRDEERIAWQLKPSHQNWTETCPASLYDAGARDFTFYIPYKTPAPSLVLEKLWDALRLMKNLDTNMPLFIEWVEYIAKVTDLNNEWANILLPNQDPESPQAFAMRRPLTPGSHFFPLLFPQAVSRPFKETYVVGGEYCSQRAVIFANDLDDLVAVTNASKILPSYQFTFLSNLQTNSVDFLPVAPVPVRDTFTLLLEEKLHATHGVARRLSQQTIPRQVTRIEDPLFDVSTRAWPRSFYDAVRQDMTIQTSGIPTQTLSLTDEESTSEGF